MKTINNKDFLGMIASGANNLENYEKEINTLNVFPVPDGDTGTNMTMTFSNGYKEASASMSRNISEISKALSKGLLMGARGNSGVITSQIFRGFAKKQENKEVLTTKDLCDGFVEGARTAYKAIMKPVEGTILTVIKEAAYYTDQELKNNPNLEIEEYISLLYKYSKEALDKTPDLLPTLKEAGVVDSGGAGLVRIFEGFKAYIEGKPVVKKDSSLVELNNQLDDADYIGYSVKLKLLLNNEYRNNFDISIINKRLESICENIVLNKNKEIIDLELNTLKPGEVLNVVQRYGEFINLEITNPSLKDYKEKEDEKEYGIIVVSQGDGLNNLFSDLGADKVISGGQTMNPSTQDFIEKIKELDNCKNIIILPNNSNIILAAEQAKQLSKKNVIVIPSKSIQAGLSAMAVFDANKDLKQNEDVLTDAVKNVFTAQVTYAVKDTSFEGVEVKENDYISIVEKTILDSNPNLKEICIKTIDELTKHDGDILTIICGENSNEEVSNELVEYAESLNKFDVELIEGNQPVYSYLFSLE